MNDQGVK